VTFSFHLLLSPIDSASFWATFLCLSCSLGSLTTFLFIRWGPGVLTSLPPVYACLQEWRNLGFCPCCCSGGLCAHCSVSCHSLPLCSHCMNNIPCRQCCMPLLFWWVYCLRGAMVCCMPYALQTSLPYSHHHGRHMVPCHSARFSLYSPAYINFFTHSCKILFFFCIFFS